MVNWTKEEYKELIKRAVRKSQSRPKEIQKAVIEEIHQVMNQIAAAARRKIAEGENYFVLLVILDPKTHTPFAQTFARTIVKDGGFQMRLPYHAIKTTQKKYSQLIRLASAILKKNIKKSAKLQKFSYELSIDNKRSTTIKAQCTE